MIGDLEGRPGACSTISTDAPVRASRTTCSCRTDAAITGARFAVGSSSATGFALHHAIITASRNSLLVTMYAEIERARKGEIWGSRNDSCEGAARC